MADIYDHSIYDNSVHFQPSTPRSQDVTESYMDTDPVPSPRTTEFNPVAFAKAMGVAVLAVMATIALIALYHYGT